MTLETEFNNYYYYSDTNLLFITVIMLKYLVKKLNKKSIHRRYA